MHYNGAKINVDSSTTTLSFIAPSLPDGEHDGVVMVMVIATNQFGVGPESDSEFAAVTGIVAYLDNICVFYLSQKNSCIFLLHHVMVRM